MISATSGIAKPVVKGSVDAVTGKPTLTWGAIEGAAKYEIYRSTKSTKSYKLLTTVAPKTTGESAEVTRLKAKLKAIVDAGIVRMVTQGVTEESRSSFLDSLRSGGSEDYTRVYQQILERWEEK